MSNKNLTIWLTVVAIIAVVGWFIPVQLAPSAGASGTRFPNGVSADSTSPSAGQVRGATLTLTGASTLGGTVTVTTTNTATSTLSVGCLQLVSTTTAQPIKLVFMATSTYSNGSVLAQSGAAATPDGIVLFKLGSCP